MTMSNDTNGTSDAYKFCAGCKQPLPTHMGPHGETTSGILIINKKDIRFDRTPGAIVTRNDGPKHSVFCPECGGKIGTL